MMKRGFHTIAKPQVLTKVDFNLYLLFLNVRRLCDSERELVDRVMMMIAWRARTPDEYEPNPYEVHPIGSQHVTIGWLRMNWHIEDFLMLLVDVDNVVERENFLRSYQAGHVDQDHPNVMARYHHYTSPETQPNEYALAALEHPFLSNTSTRHFLQRYLFWLAVHLDTRIERIACKMNTTLMDFHYDCPSPSKVRNMRRALRSCLLHYAYGYCTEDEFSAMMLEAYTTGITPDHEPDAPALNPEPTCIFDPYTSAFEEHLDDIPWLVIRDPHLVEREEDGREEEEGGGEEEELDRMDEEAMYS